MNKLFLLHVVKGINPSVDHLLNKTERVVFTYTTDSEAARALKIPDHGQMFFNLTCCILSSALINVFVVKGKSIDDRLLMNGTYYPVKEVGKLAVCMNVPK
ncbi:MAG: hypothetical protein WC725_04505 [Patescibacteria group bacterium]|jgi:hypothetical protein